MIGISASTDAAAVGSRERGIVWFCAALPLLVKLVCYPGYPGSDDAFIHLTIVRNLTEGLGWGINPNQPVNLSSSPLFTALIGASHLCGADSLLSAQLISAVSGVLALILLHWLLAALQLAPIARIAGVICAAANFYLWRWNAVGMETTLAMLLLTLSCLVFYRANRDAKNDWQRDTLTGICAGLAVLTRFELGLILPCFALQLLVKHRPGWWLAILRLAVGSLIITIPWFLFCWLYFGAVLPSTFYAKTSSGLILWNPSVGGDLIKLVGSAFTIPLVAVGLLLGFAIGKRQIPPFLPLFSKTAALWLFPCLLALFYYLKTPVLQSSARYFLPAMHLAAAVIAVVLSAFLANFSAIFVRKAVTGALALHVGVALTLNQVYVTPILSRFRENYWNTMRSAAELLRANEGARRAGVLVEVDIGMLSYYAGPGIHFYDGGALASPELRNLTVHEQVSQTNPGVVIETLGESVAGLAQELPNYELIWTRAFLSHSLTHPKKTFVCNLYEVAR